MRIPVLPLIVLLLASAPAGAEVFYYRDGEGRIQLSDSPVHAGFKKITPEEKSQINLVEVAPAPPGSGDAGDAAPSDPAEGADRSERVAAEPELYEVDDNRFARIIYEAAAASRLDPNLVRAVIKVESDFNPNDVSRTGAKGLMQLMPVTAREVGVTDPFDPRQNVFGGSAYLRKMLDRFHDDRELALAAYNAGPGRVEKAGNRVPDIKETRNYVRKVAHYYARFGGLDPAVGRTETARRQAIAAWRRGQSRKAVELFRQAIRDYPADAVSHYNLGFIYSKEGFYQKAIRMYRTAITLDPYMSAAYYNLAVTLERRGDTPEAIRVWQGYIDHEASPEKVATARGYIAELEKYIEDR